MITFPLNWVWDVLGRGREGGRAVKGGSIAGHCIYPSELCEVLIKPDFDPCEATSAPALVCKFWGPGTTSHYVLHSNYYRTDPGFVSCSAPTLFTVAKQNSFSYDNGASFHPSHGPPQMVGSTFGGILGFSAASPLVFRVELDFTRSICVFLTYYLLYDGTGNESAELNTI